jgi:N-acetylmuramoyl-L-alanine amidase
MSNNSLISQLLIILLSAVAFIFVSLNYHVGEVNQRNSSQTPKLARSRSLAEAMIESELILARDVATYYTTAALARYQPKSTIATIHFSNYGERYSTDVYGNSLNNLPIVVLHETTDSVTSAINTFRTPHKKDSNQVSYHALISVDGTITYLLSSAKRAFGAGNSAFFSSSGIETVKTNPNLPSSVNNFAYHISLETPPSGRSKPSQARHSGYTDSQYKSLAWLIAQTNIPDNRITTHKNVDRSGHKIDPRSFDFDKFLTILHTYRQPLNRG